MNRLWATVLSIALLGCARDRKAIASAVPGDRRAAAAYAAAPLIVDSFVLDHFRVEVSFFDPTSTIRPSISFRYETM